VIARMLGRRHRAIARTTLCVVAFATAGASLHAQQVRPAPTDTAPSAAVQTPPSQPTAVPAPDIGFAAGRTIVAVRALSLELARQPQIVEIERALPRTTKDIAALRDATDVTPLSVQPLADLEDLESRWSDVAATVDRWQDRLRRRADALVARRDSLGAMRRVWVLTRDSAEAQQLPPALRGRVADVLREIDQVDSTLRERLDAVLTVQSRVADLGLEVARVSAEVGRARAEAARRLLVPERPPLWRELFGERPDSAGASPGVRQLAQARASAAASYLRGRLGNLAVLAAVFLVVTGVVVALGRRGRALGVDMSELTPLLRRPASTGLLVTVLLKALLMPGGPALVINGTVLLALLPLARLVPGTAPGAWRRPMTATLAVMVLVLITRVVETHPLLERFSLLAVSLLAFMGAMFLRRSGPPPAEAVRYGWAVHVLVTIAAVLLAAAVLLNVAGFVSLSGLLLSGVAYSGTAAVAFFVGARAGVGMIRALIRWGLARALSAARTHQEDLLRRATRLIRVIALTGWVWATLRAFRIGGVLDAVRSMLTARLRVGVVSVSLWDVLLFGLVLWVTVLVSRAVRFVLDEDVLPPLALPRGVPGTVSTLVYYLLLTLGFVFAVGAVGLDLSRLTLLAGAFGIGIGFGLQNIVNNFVSGLILKFERPIAVGDVIELDTMMGTTQRIGIRSSTIRTFAGAEVIVPNADLVAGRVVNWTLSDRRRRIEIAVGVSYGSDPRRVLELLAAVAGEHPKVLDDPAPTVLFKRFGDSALEFELRCWTGDFDQWVLVSSEVTTAIHAALKGAGIEIPFPQRDLHLRTVAPAAAASLSDRERPPG